MNFLLFVLSGLSILLAPAVFFLAMSLGRTKKQAQQWQVQVATCQAQLESLQKDSHEMKGLREQASHYLEQKSIAETQRDEAIIKGDALKAERDQALAAKEHAVMQANQVEKRTELTLQKMADVEKRMQDWELQRQESLQAAKASIMQVGQDLSSKLLEDHKREAEAAKKEGEETIKKTSDALLEQVMNVTKSVASLKGQTIETSEKMSTVWKALTTPAGAGALAEIGLENSLKNLGLEVGRDYVMQYAIQADEAGALRPDAVLFLPQDMVMVIDSKASKFVLEIAQAISAEAEVESLQRLKKTMNDHLKALVSKDYSAAIQSAWKKAGKAHKISTILSVMYLPSESAIEHLKRADAEFMEKTEKAGIILAGPASLAGLLSLARLNIGMMRQAENQDVIISTLQELMDSIVTMLNFADNVGLGIKRAAENFSKFTGSVNNRLLPKMKKMMALGVKPVKAKDIPAKLTSYEIRASDDVLTIEGEAETVTDFQKLSA